MTPFALVVVVVIAAQSHSPEPAASEPASPEPAASEPATPEPAAPETAARESPAPEPRSPEPAAPAPEPASPDAPNRMLAAGVAAGATCLATPTLPLAAGLGLAAVPCLLVPACAAAGAAGGLVLSAAPLDALTIGVAAGIGAAGALTSAAVGIPYLIFTSSQAAASGTSADALDMNALLLWVGIAGAIGLVTSAGVGAAVFLLAPDEAAGAADGVSARARPPATSTFERVAMTY